MLCFNGDVPVYGETNYCIMRILFDYYRVSKKNPKTIENDLLLEFQSLALN